MEDWLSNLKFHGLQYHMQFEEPMNMDIHTLAIILSITNLLQVIALMTQYFINKSYHGLGWWALGTATWSLAFVFNYVRDMPGIGDFATVANNFLFMLGAIWLHIGLAHFLGKPEHGRPLYGSLAIFLLICIYYTYFDYSLAARRVLVSFSGMGIMFLLAQEAFFSKLRSVRVPALILALAMAANGVFFFIRGLTPFTGQVGDPFSASLIQTITYLMMLVTSSLWTFSFIMMINQRLNEESREARESIERIFSASPDGMVVSRLGDGYFTNVNERFARLTGYTRDETLGRTANELHIWLNPADRQKMISTLQETGFYDNLETVLQGKDSSLHTSLVSARVIDLQGVPHMISVVHDISERKRMEEELRAAQTELEQRVQARTADLQTANLSLEKALSARNEFLAAMSHELRTPLTGVMGLAQVLQLQTYGPLAEKQINALKNIENSGQHLLELINDILDYANIQSGKLVLEKKTCNLGEVCQAALKTISAEAARKHQQTSLQIDPPDLSLPADSARLKKILQHLIGNASKFTAEGGRFGIEALRQAGEVVITVWDTGIGIRDEDRPRLFKPFSQLDARLERKYNGAGLGLALVKGLVDLHGGRIELESAPDLPSKSQGSRFTVILPAE